MRKLLLISIILFFYTNSFSQELKCNISVSSSQIQGTNKQVFRTMQTALSEFMNSRRWTENVFSYDERIECNIQINLTDQISADEFAGTMQITARRPVFNSSYKTALLNFRDKDINFKYVEFQPIEFNEQSVQSNLSSLLAYYAYIIIGLDYDSYSMQGGSVYFTKAEAIVTKMQNSVEKGWKSFESRRNRYWLVENLLNNAYSPVRDCFYTYHRLGLDRMSDRLSEGRADVLEGLKSLQKAHRAKPGAFILQVFFDAKSEEIVNVFSESFIDEKTRVYNILNEVDPAHIKSYKKIIGNKR